MSEVNYNTPIPDGTDELTDDQMNALANEPIDLDNSELTDDQMYVLADAIIPGSEESTEEPVLQEDNGEGISY